MRCRLLTAATMAAVLLLGPVAATAFAQEGFADEGFGSCVAAVAQLDDSPLVGDIDGDERPSLEDLIARGLNPAQICTIYGVDVLPVVEEREPPEETEVAGEVITAQPTDVLGTSLAVTGANTLLLALVGAVLVGLGVLAVRRPKRVDHGA
ncbi:MAG: LPXTG cell wall anchor domain-containing protein [Nitriliruptoraceae bacterium]